MAIKWGSWAYGQAGSRSRLGVDRSTSTTASQITVTIVVYLEFAGYYMNSNATLTASGGHSGSRAVSLNFSSSGTRNLGTFTQTFTRPWGSHKAESTQFSISGSAGGNPTIGEGYYLPRRLYSAPATPSSVTATWSEDGRAALSWSVSASTSAPVPSVEIVRQSNNNSWGTNASTFSQRSGSTTFSNLSRGNRYRWRVRGKNQDATGPWGTSGWVYMRPNDVSNVVASRSGSNIVVSWVNRDALDYAGYRIYDNGSLVGTVSAGTTSFTHTAPDPAQTHRYSVRAYYGSLQAAHVYSNTVQLLSAPLPPTNLNPNGGYAVAGSSQRLEWDHNSVDGTGQTAYQLRVRKGGSSTWTTYTGTSTGYRNITISTFAGHDEYIEWQVRTKGDHASYSPWSAVSSFEVVSRPTMTISAPTEGATIPGWSTIVTMWFSRVPVSYTIEQRDSSNQVMRTYTEYATTSPSSHQITGFRDNQSYSIRVWATDRVDSAVVTRSFSASFAQPEPPTVSGSWDVSRGAALITVTPPESSNPYPSRLRIERVDGTVVAEGPATGVNTLRDEHAPLDGSAQYVAFSVAPVGPDMVESPSSDILDLGIIPEPADFLNFGGEVVRIRHSPGFTRSSASTNLQLIELDDGTPDPVAIFGPKERHVANLSGLILDAPGWSAREQAAVFQALGTWKDLVLLRPLDGPPVWGVVTGLTQPRELWGGYHVALTHTKAR